MRALQRLADEFGVAVVVTNQVRPATSLPGVESWRRFAEGSRRRSSFANPNHLDRARDVLFFSFLPFHTAHVGRGRECVGQLPFAWLVMQLFWLLAGHAPCYALASSTAGFCAQGRHAGVAVATYGRVMSPYYEARVSHSCSSAVVTRVGSRCSPFCCAGRGTGGRNEFQPRS